MSVTQTLPFGTLLKQLRKRAGMTQRDLAAALGYSDSLISSLEKGQRLPDIKVVAERFVPALGLQDDATMASHLIDSAAAARGERSPSPHSHAAIRAPVRDVSPAELRHGLPALPIELIGRDETINQLGNRLLGHGGRLLTLTGAPGVGKTTLALAIAAHVQPHYRAGAHFVPLAAISDPMLMAATIVTTVAPSDASAKPPQARLIELLRHQAILLILDNLEQITGAAPVLGALLTECPALAILATSRERIHLRAEQRFKVPPLDLVPAIELFVQRAQAVEENFQLTDHNQSTVAAICTCLDCLPLALELCAAQVELFSPAQLLTQLQARPLDLLVDGAHDLPPRHRTLRQAIQRSYALLNLEEQALFRRLGVFAGGFDLEAVEAISTTPAFSGILRALIGKSLVRAETLVDGEQRFFLLETIREFALEQLQVHGEAEAARQYHYAFYLQLFRTGDGYVRGPKAATWMVRLESEQENLRYALQWKLDIQQPIDAAWLLMAVHYFWFTHAQRYEAGQWLTKLLPYRHQLPLDLQLMTLINFYGSALGLEGFQALDGYKNELMELLDDCTDVRLQAAGWYFLLFSSTSSQTITMTEKFVASARSAYSLPPLDPKFCMAADRDYILAANLWVYGRRLIDQGEFARAVPVATETLQLLRKQGNQLVIAHSLASLGRLATFQGDLAKAYTYFHEAVTIARIFQNRYIQCSSQLFLGLVTLYWGETVTALQLLSESLHFSLEMQDMFLLARTYTYLAELSLLEGDLEQANHWWTQS